MNYDRLVDHLKEKYAHADTTNFCVLDFLSAFGSPLDALMYGTLYWPEFVEYRGVVTLRSVVATEQIDSALEGNGGDVSETERSLNVIEVPSFLFAHHETEAETTEDEDRCLAHMLARTWECALREKYPNRRFNVLVEEPEGGLEVTVRFWRVADST